MKTLEQIIGENIRTLRKEKGWTQSDLAKNAKISVQTVNILEKGKRAAQRANLSAIAKALNCTPEKLYQSVSAGGGPLSDLLRLTPEMAHEIREGARQAVLDSMPPMKVAQPTLAYEADIPQDIVQKLRNRSKDVYNAVRTALEAFDERKEIKKKSKITK